MTAMAQPGWRWPLEKSSLYVIQFDQGTIKVGHTLTPKDRLTNLRYQAAQFGIRIVHQWVSDIHPSGPRLEKDLIRWCSERATGGHGVEWFTGLDFDDVKACAISLLAESEAA